ncbi:MAG TPA: metallophosphoesterase [Terriglobales bacterium]|nr:metallophosphoesterase [Terriglobales bacterium]
MTSSSKIGETGSFLLVCRRTVAHWRAIILVLILAVAAFLVAHDDFFDLFTLALFLIFIASQLFWIGRILDLGERFIPGKPLRAWLAIVAGLVYLFVFAYSFPGIESSAHVFRAADYRLHRLVIEAAYWWWFVGSQVAFLLVIAFGMADRAARATAWVYGKAREAMRDHGAALMQGAMALDPPSPARRHFLEQAAVLISATPFVAAGYGLLYGRLDVEVVRQRIRLARLPKAFEGFRIAQLSDIHIGPFTTADYIRHCVTITDGLKPDLVVLTGDYISWDPEAEGEAVHALAGLRAPHGVFGCLGNHEQEGEIEESITPLFAAQGIRILRQERATIRLSGETLNLIGMDEPRGRSRAEWKQDVFRRLEQLKGLVMPGTVNILLLHYSAVFHYVSDLNIDLTLAGHTHGGQLSLGHPGLSLGRLVTPYDRGWYEKDGRQLYVNRGIGTTGFPIRLGARPEITVFELTREA